MAGIPHHLSRRKILFTGLFLVLAEFLFPAIGLPGPISLARVSLYNGYQSARTAAPNLTARYRRQKAAGPQPDSRVVAASNAFGFRILKMMAAERPGENVFFSPYSLSASLAMTANGAAGETREEMWRALGLSGVDEETVNASFNRLATLLEYTDPRMRVRSANSLWADESSGMREEYAKKVSQAFQAGVEEIDLQSPESAARIENWIKRHTDGHIRGMAPKPAPDHAVILANALYFTGEWTHQFKRSATRPATFHLADGREKQVPMMAKSNVPIDVYGEGELFALFRLPYGDGSMSMIIVLPDLRPPYEPSMFGTNLQEVIAKMTLDAWDRSMSGLEHHRMSVRMPRFRVEEEPAVETAAKATGFAGAFGAGADLTRMCPPTPGAYIGSLRQKAFMEVDESGTRAGAATIVIVEARGRPRHMEVDRPFLCAIRDDRTGLILFLGAIYDPEVM